MSACASGFEDPPVVHSQRFHQLISDTQKNDKHIILVESGAGIGQEWVHISAEGTKNLEDTRP
jgi:hypothetical protein